MGVIEEEVVDAEVILGEGLDGSLRGGGQPSLEMGKEDPSLRPGRRILQHLEDRPQLPVSRVPRLLALHQEFRRRFVLHLSFLQNFPSENPDVPNVEIEIE